MLVVAFVLLAPTEMRLPAGAMCPDAVNQGGVVHVVYGETQSAWYTRYGSDGRVRVNSKGGSVHAGGERGPKIAVSNGTISVVWQDDYRQGPKVWFARSTDGGKSFEPQRNLIDGKTPGLDHIAVAAAGNLVAVFWLDGRGGQDPDAPVTSTIWYSLSRDGGKTFGANQGVYSTDKMRACACCSFAVSMTADGKATIAYRSGIKNVRDIWLATGNVGINSFTLKPVSSSGWVLTECPMDGPRRSEKATAYMVQDNAYFKLDSGEPMLLGPGKYPNLVQTKDEDFVTWQNGSTLFWRWVRSGESGRISVDVPRATVVAGPDGKPLIIH